MQVSGQLRAPVVYSQGISSRYSLLIRVWERTEAFIGIIIIIIIIIIISNDIWD
jgi:hypothetical protein